MTRISGFICKDCGEPFTMDKSEIEFYENNELEQPKRCPECRKRRREIGVEFCPAPKGESALYQNYLNSVSDARD